MAGPRPRQIVEPLELVVAVDDLQRDRAAERDAVPDAGENVDRVGFDPLPAAAAVAALPPPQLDVDRLDVDGHAGRKAVDQRDQRFAVRFAGGPVAEHGRKSVIECRRLTFQSDLETTFATRSRRISQPRSCISTSSCHDMADRTRIASAVRNVPAIVELTGGNSGSQIQ